MIGKKSKNAKSSYTKTVKYYERYRDFIRNITIYSYRSRQEYAEIGINNRTYDDYKRILSDCIKQGFIEESFNGKEKRTRFNADMYKSSYNYLVNTYFIKSLPNNAFYYIIILQILSEGNSLLINEIEDIVYEKINDKDISTSTLYRALCKLTDSGLLKTSKLKNRIYYQLVDNILDQLTAKELQELYNAVSFFTNVSPLSVPGYYLANTISQYMENKKAACPEKNLFWQYRFCNYSKIVDDEVIYIILQAIENKKSLKISYDKNKKSILLVPEALRTDYPYGRTYLYTTKHVAYKVEKITKIQVISPKKAIKPATSQKVKKPAAKKLDLIFTFKATDDEREVTAIKHRLQQEAAWMHCTELDKEHYRYTATVQDAFSLVPWIRTFHKYVSLGSDTDTVVKERLEKDKMEALQKYGIIQ
ncbi:WYL domain-containing protein [Phascolarctobacterium succinatutens]|uniref:WYL domain-containing protein n=1 Tax=Phascolarctobacterium succinatutens TaxID=626940 RepID=UPI0026EC1830|nr:WYL domain-containing protein [Phascolarctobacterium succinatutens]